MTPISPLFNITHIDKPESIRVSFPNTHQPTTAINQYQGTAPRVLMGSSGPNLITTTSSGPYQMIPVGSIYEAEDYLIGFADQIQVDGSAADLAITISDAQTRIAGRSRRAYGNTVLLHPDLWTEIASLDCCQVLPDDDQKSYGRWTLVGQMHHGASVFTSDVMSVDTCVVLYRDLNSELLDGPAVLFDNSESMQLL